MGILAVFSDAESTGDPAQDRYVAGHCGAVLPQAGPPRKIKEGFS